MFRVIEQTHYGAYNIHLFEDQLHFKAYQLVHRRDNFERASQAHGRQQYTIDHRNEIDYPVADKLVELIATA